MLIFFFNDTATTEIYTLSLHDALPISAGRAVERQPAVEGRDPVGQAPQARAVRRVGAAHAVVGDLDRHVPVRSEEHTSELQSRQYLVCRLLLEKKKTRQHTPA